MNQGNILILIILRKSLFERLGLIVQSLDWLGRAEVDGAFFRHVGLPLAAGAPMPGDELKNILRGG